MSISAMKQALEALESWQKTCLDCGRGSEELGRATQPITELRQAIAEVEKQEPAFYVIPATDRFGEGYEQTYWEDPAGFPVYTTRPQREWVGLAVNEAREFYESDLSREELIHKIDEFLQEKNT